MGEWKSAFLRAGVNAKKVSPTAFGKHDVLESSASMEPELKRQVMCNLLLLWVSKWLTLRWLYTGGNDPEFSGFLHEDCDENSKGSCAKDHHELDDR